MTLALNKISETASTLTLGWTPPQGVGGYVFYANTVAVSTGSANLKDGAPRNSIKFSKASPGPPFQVAAVCRQSDILLLDVGTYSEAPPPPPPPPPPPGSNYYVSPSGSDSASGSSGSPWKTIAKACASVSGPAVINVAAGTYVEQGFRVPNGVSMVGAGRGQTIVQCGAMARLAQVLDTTAPQTISDLTLDGRGRSTADYGLWVENAKQLTLTRLEGKGFKAPQDHSGGGINVKSATDFVLADIVLTNNGGSQGAYCTGNLGLGNLTRAEIARVVVTADQGYCVKQSSTFQPATDVNIHDCRFDAQSGSCSSWNNLAVELWLDARNVRFHHNWINRTLSIPQGGPDSQVSPYRWRIDHNHFQTASAYAIEAGFDWSEIDHNFFEGGYYPLGHFHSGDVQNQINVHHNVFDKQVTPCNVWLDVWQVTNAKFHKNTVIARSATRDGLFSFGESRGHPNDNTMDARDNIFMATSAIGDKMGKGIGAVAFDHNLFHNITGKGSGQTNTNPGLSLSGGFPSAYVSSSVFGAFADGAWSDIGPQ